jgi:CSLREA domain-containing protein
MSSSVGRSTATISVLTAVGFMSVPGLALGATITVNTTADALNADGSCSLREAISAANLDSAGPGGECATGSGVDTVSVPGGEFTLSLPAGFPAGENANAGGDLDVLSDLTIAGAGAGATTINANGIDRALEIRPGRIATIRGVTITGGRAPNGFTGFSRTGDPGAPDGEDAQGDDGTPGAPGGGIFNNGGSLTVLDTVVTGNQAGTGGQGGNGTGGFGATANAGGVGGRGDGGKGGAGGDGGGIQTTGVLVLTRVTVTGNAAGAGGTGGLGIGGQGGAAITSAGGAGGVGLGGGGGGGGRGGGVSESGGGSLEIHQSTITQNTAGAAGPGGNGEGGDGGLSGGTSGTGGKGGTAQGGIGGFHSPAGDGAGGGGVAATDPAVVTESLITQNAAGAPGRGGNGTGGDGGVTTGGAASVSGDGGPGFSGQAGPASPGGGLWLTGSVTNTTIIGNTAGPGGDAGNATGGKGGNSQNGTGGDGGPGIADNLGGRGAPGGAGGGLNAGVDLGRTTTVRHATFTGNVAGAAGAGGTGVGGLGGSAPTPGSAGTAQSGPAGTPGDGSAVDPSFFGNTVSLANSVVTGNSGPACANSVTNAGNNISFNDATCPGANVDPKLGTLANNGGPTQTLELLPGSPAIDGVPATGAGCAATDQRGVVRPNDAACDIGAYEHAPPTVTPGAATDVSTGAATLLGQLNPNARSTSFHFEFGPTIAYGTSTPTQTQDAGTDSVPVSAAVSGLDPVTTYHFRLVATNADGTTNGPDRTFDTAAVQRTMQISKAGSGTGTVKSVPAGIDCGATCSQAYADGTVVELTATPAGASKFTGWSGGGCAGSTACTVTMSADQAVTAGCKAAPAGAPDTRITRARINERKRKAKFEFTGSGGVRSLRALKFQCKLTHQSRKLRRWRSCSSPKVYKHLKPGRHAFKARAIDARGTADPTPAKKRFRISPGGPATGRSR